MGGLGILDLERFGTALRLRWLWLERTTLERPWIGLPVPCGHPERVMFAAATSTHLRDGRTASFWFDSWMHGEAPCLVAPAIFQLSRRKMRTVRGALTDNRWVRDVQGRVTTKLLPKFVRLWTKVTAASLLTDGRDEFMWKLAESGVFSTASAYRLLFLGSTNSPIQDAIWKAWAPVKLKMFAWLLSINRLLTADRLMAR